MARIDVAEEADFAITLQDIMYLERSRERQDPARISQRRHFQAAFDAVRL